MSNPNEALESLSKIVMNLVDCTRLLSEATRELAKETRHPTPSSIASTPVMAKTPASPKPKPKVVTDEKPKTATSGKPRRKRRTKAEMEAARAAEEADLLGNDDAGEAIATISRIAREDIIDAAKEYYKTKGGDALMMVNKRFKIDKASEAPPEIYDDLYEALTV